MADVVTGGLTVRGMHHQLASSSQSQALDGQVDTRSAVRKTQFRCARNWKKIVSCTHSFCLCTPRLALPWNYSIIDFPLCPYSNRAMGIKGRSQGIAGKRPKKGALPSSREKFQTNGGGGGGKVNGSGTLTKKEANPNASMPKEPVCFSF